MVGLAAEAPGARLAGRLTALADALGLQRLAVLGYLLAGLSPQVARMRQDCLLALTKVP